MERAAPRRPTLEYFLNLDIGLPVGELRAPIRQVSPAGRRSRSGRTATTSGGDPGQER